MRSLFVRLVLALLVLLVPVTALAVLYAEPFEPLRRAAVERLLSDVADVTVEVRGPITISFDWEPAISIADVVAKPSDLPTDLKGISIKSLAGKLPLLPLFAGQAQLNSLTIDGLKVAIGIPKGGAADGGMDVAQAVSDFLRSHYADDLLLRNGEVDYVNQDNGFILRYEVDTLESKASADGSVVVKGAGRLNGEPWNLDGNVDPPGGDPDARKFAFSMLHASVKNALAGSYRFGTPTDTVDVILSATTPNLMQLLATYGIRGDLDASADMSGRLTGSLDALKLTNLDLKLAFETGDKFELTGDIADIGAGTGLELNLSGSLARTPPAPGEAQPLYDIGITGFNGRIEGSVDGVLVRDFHVHASSITANLREIGPITAERVYRDPEGLLGLYDVLVLAGDAERPSVRVAGTVRDIIAFRGVDLKGGIDFLTADFLDLAAEGHAEELGHLVGNIAISDADGTLGIEQLTAQVKDSALIKLSIDLVFDDIREVNELKFATHLDIPNLKPFAAALGSEVAEDAAVTFDGTLAGSKERIVLTGTTVIGQTTLTGSLAGARSQGRPVLTGDISSPLLYLADLRNLASINTVYEENVDEKDADVFDYSKVWESLFVDLQINVAKINGSTEASNLAGRVTYLAGVIGLDPLTLTYLGGTASASGEINTTAAQKTFALKGSVNNLRIGNVLREMRVSYPISGSLQVTYDLTGTGNTMAQIPRSLNGSLSLSLRNGWIGTSLLDLAGMSLPAWLLTRVPGGNQAKLVCAVAPFSFNNGRGSTSALVLETNNVQVVGAGTVDFRNDRVDLRFRPRALQNQFIKIAQPFEVQGRLGSPTVRLTGAPVAGAVTQVLAFPLNLVGAVVQPQGNGRRHVPCRVAPAR